MKTNRKTRHAAQTMPESNEKKPATKQPAAKSSFVKKFTKIVSRKEYKEFLLMKEKLKEDREEYEEYKKENIENGEEYEDYETYNARKKREYEEYKHLQWEIEGDMNYLCYKHRSNDCDCAIEKQEKKELNEQEKIEQERLDQIRSEREKEKKEFFAFPIDTEKRQKSFQLLPQKWKDRCEKLINRNDIQTFSEKEEFCRVALPLYLYKKGYNATRLGKILVLIYVIWEYDVIKKLTLDEKMNLCINIELSCYTYVLEKARKDNIILSWTNANFCNYYHEICAKIIANLDSRIENPNDYLIEMIMNKKILIMNLPKLQPFELYPKKYENILDKINKAKEIEFTIKTTTMYTCRKCFARKCKIENRQNRSLDEGVNITITCMSCQNTWNG